MKQRLTFLVLLFWVAMAARADLAQADDISIMRMHLECGWFEQLSTGSDGPITDAAEYHIVAGGRLAADLGFEGEALAAEVTDASRRVIDGISSSGYIEQMFLDCR